MKKKSAILVIVFLYLTYTNAQSILDEKMFEKPVDLNMTKFKSTNIEKDNFMGWNSFETLSPKIRLIASASFQGKDNGWVNGDSVTYTFSGSRGGTRYSEDIQTDERIDRRWNGIEYSNFTRRVSTYTENNLLLTSTSYRWSDSGWNFSVGYWLSYDDNGNLIKEYWEFGSGSAWYATQYTYTYNSNNQLTSRLQQTTIDKIMENDLIYEYGYDSVGNNTIGVTRYWTEEKKWEILGKWEAEYDNSGNQISFVSFNPFEGMWVPVNRQLFTYDNNHNILTSTSQRYVAGDWENRQRNNYTFPAGSNYYSVFLWQNWENNQWENYLRWTYDFQPNREYYDHIVKESWNEDKWLIDWEEEYKFNSFGLVESYEQLKNEDGNFVPGFKSNYYFEVFDVGTVSLDEIESPSPVTLLANPINGQLSFRINNHSMEDLTLRLFDMNGKLVLQQKRNSGSGAVLTFPVHHLPSGVYVYKLQSRDVMDTGKIINR